MSSQLFGYLTAVFFFSFSVDTTDGMRPSVASLHRLFLSYRLLETNDVCPWLVRRPRRRLRLLLRWGVQSTLSTPTLDHTHVRWYGILLEVSIITCTQHDSLPTSCQNGPVHQPCRQVTHPDLFYSPRLPLAQHPGKSFRKESELTHNPLVHSG